MPNENIGLGGMIVGTVDSARRKSFNINNYYAAMSEFFLG